MCSLFFGAAHVAIFVFISPSQSNVVVASPKDAEVCSEIQPKTTSTSLLQTNRRTQKQDTFRSCVEKYGTANEAFYNEFGQPGELTLVVTHIVNVGAGFRWKPISDWEGTMQQQFQGQYSYFLSSDSANMWPSDVAGLKVFVPHNISGLLNSWEIDEILEAIRRLSGSPDAAIESAVYAQIVNGGYSFCGYLLVQKLKWLPTSLQETMCSKSYSGYLLASFRFLWTNLLMSDCFRSQWHMTADDDTFVNPPDLLNMVNGMDHTVPIAAGCTGCEGIVEDSDGVKQKQSSFCGGTGIIISDSMGKRMLETRSTLAQIAVASFNKSLTGVDVCDPYGTFYDVILSKHVHAIEGEKAMVDIKIGSCVVHGIKTLDKYASARKAFEDKNAASAKPQGT